MPKRRNPFGDGSPLQLKTHIGTKELNTGVSGEQNLKAVYGNHLFMCSFVYIVYMMVALTYNHDNSLMIKLISLPLRFYVLFLPSCAVALHLMHNHTKKAGLLTVFGCCQGFFDFVWTFQCENLIVGLLPVNQRGRGIF